MRWARPCKTTEVEQEGHPHVPRVCRHCQLRRSDGGRRSAAHRRHQAAPASLGSRVVVIERGQLPKLCSNLYYTIRCAPRSFAYPVSYYESKGSAPNSPSISTKNIGTLCKHTRCEIMANDQDKVGQQGGTAQINPGDFANDCEKAFRLTTNLDT